MPKKNDVLRLEITDMTPEGAGVGRYDGYVLFVFGTAPGDIIDALVMKAGKSYGYAKAINIVKPSPYREDSDCSVFGRCGGCVFRHIKYEKELEIKKKTVDENLKRLGGLDIECERIIPSPQINGYRNKAQYPAAVIDGKMRFGFYSRHSHRVAPCESCPLQPDFYAEIVRAVGRFCDENKITAYDEETGKGLLRHLYIRDGRRSGEILVCLVATGEVPNVGRLIKMLTELNKNIKSIVLNVNNKDTNVILSSDCRTLWGNDAISDVLCGLEFEISPRSFYQVNHDGAEKLYGIAAEFAEPEGKTVLDLYCGTGTIGLSMARRAKNVIGAEIIPEAVENAKNNAERNGINNAEFICADAGEAAEKLARDGLLPDVIIVDPPRSGCSEQTLSAIAEMAPERVVMVSCDSATAARDCKRLSELGYRAEKAVAVDMFARTGHVETVVQLVRKKPDTYIDITVDMDELDLTSSEAKATYDEIKDYIFDKHRVKVSSLYVAQVKQKHGIIERDCYNNSKKDNTKQPQCPPEKVKLIEEALRHFKMIP